jgi:thioredoxin 2
MTIDASETIVCTSCGAINRASSSRLAEGMRPNCGSCHAPLFTALPHEVSSEAELERILAKTSLPVLIDFWAPWCGPCLQMAPHFKAAAQALEPRVRLLKVDTEKLPAAAGANGVRGIPTLILFVRGREKRAQPGCGLGRVMSQTRVQLAPKSGLASSHPDRHLSNRQNSCTSKSPCLRVSCPAGVAPAHSACL